MAVVMQQQIREKATVGLFLDSTAPPCFPLPLLPMGGGSFPLGALHPLVGFHTFKFSSNTPLERAICFLLRPRLIPNYEK